MSSCAFLDILPLEIRDKIYNHVFSSPTGHVELRKQSHPVSPDQGNQYRIVPRYTVVTTSGNDSDTDLHLSFLRTCKKIHRECHHKIWQLNTLDLRNFIVPFPSQAQWLPTLLPASLQTAQIQNVTIGISFVGDPPSITDLRATCDMLVRWASTSQLREITMCPVDPWVSYDACPRPEDGISVSTFHVLLMIWDICRTSPPNKMGAYQCYYDTLQNMAAQLDEAGCVVKRRLMFDVRNINYAHMRHHETALVRIWFVTSVCLKDSNPDAMLQELSSAWNCEIELNGVSYCQNGRRVAPTMFTQFRLVDGEWPPPIFYRRREPGDGLPFLFKRDAELLVLGCAAAKRLAVEEPERDPDTWIRRMLEDGEVRRSLADEMEPWVEEERARIGLSD